MREKTIDAEALVRRFENDRRYKNVRNTALLIMEAISLPYHGGVDHPLEFEKYALAIAVREDVPEHFLPLLSLAAVLHETGVIVSYKDHEFESAKMARRLMGNAGYPAEDVILVEDLIFYGTRCFPQTPRSELEKIMADADLANLGTDEFFRKGELLRKELRIEDKIEWNRRQIEFVGNHAYFTSAARDMFNAQQKKNLGWLQTDRNMLLGIA